MAEPKLTILRPGYGRIEQDGHTAEGRLIVTDTNVDFSGHFICGPHDAAGNHLEGRNDG
ncbi:hypothetical protein KZC52_16795 [Microbacterium sp. kSW2-24]|uniref:hypothetical protein n=1 Tax=Microbacterium galbinum TaxID=2851646 RepID=UPI001FFCA0FE|nr:hypothetical protein [Microbacterium galbinum]MCK2024588.1 hypothetical protein [Microbacterium galbinum]